MHEDLKREAFLLMDAERNRQIEVEGWSPAHDAEHEPGHLLRAGIYYLWHGTEKAAPIEPNGVPLGWPWEPQWWKPKGRKANLIRAGALMLAERDAIVRRADGAAFHIGHVEHKLNIAKRELAALLAGNQT